MLADHPVLTLLGRRGRGAVVEALRRNPQRAWTVRDLARLADVAPMVASRAVRELAALGAVTVQRPGRDARIQPARAAPAWDVLARLDLPDLHAQAAAAFARAYARPPGTTAVLRWRHPDDDPADPLAPLRIGLVAREPEQALDHAGAALDAVRGAGYAAPEITAWTPAQLTEDDPVAQAIAAGARV